MKATESKTAVKEEEKQTKTKGARAEVPALWKRIREVTSKLTPDEKREFGIALRVEGEVLKGETLKLQFKGKNGENLRVLQELLENATCEALAAAYALYELGPRNNDLANKIAEWIDTQLEPFRQGEYGNRDMECEVLPTTKWLAFCDGIGVCEGE